MDQIEAEGLLDFILEAERRVATLHQIGNREWVVLVENLYFIWSAHDWRQFRQREEDDGQAMFDRRMASKAR